ncbi:MAG TPA: anthranilate synthase component I family protein [Thermoplasmata archaeon]|nr:anthranilate synthase component I family protein [Thermoplasmata archaeon]
MTLWEDFARTAPDREVAGYFERAPEERAGTGIALAFDRADQVITLDPSTSLSEIAGNTARFLRRPRTAVLGYLGFEAFGLVERTLSNGPAGSPFPLGELAFVEDVRPTRTARVRRRPVRVRERPRPIRDSLPLPRFRRSVANLLRAIRSGEAFQVVLAHRREWDRPDGLLARATELRASERFAFFYYLKFGDREIVGASPESVAEVRQSRAYVNPIAGTIPTLGRRGRRLPLHRDPKELAEHRMLVDLARNDLGSVSRPGSVRLVWEERRERFARLEHLVSRVGGHLKLGLGPWDVLAAAFPAGTVSGAPKIRATQLLRQEERTWRGPYGGAVTCLLPNGNADFALTIRSAFASGRRLYTAAGAGIVHRSEPDREFEETLSKLDHLEWTLLGETR